jgi:aconitate hydratase
VRRPHTTAVSFKQSIDLRALREWCASRGVWFSRPGNGAADVVHRERYAAPGRLLAAAGSTPSTCGALGMLGLPCGELELAAALGGSPVYRERLPVLGVRLEGSAADWVCGQDVALALGRDWPPHVPPGAVLEYAGPGLEGLSVADRVTLAGHGAAFGVTASVFPSDETTRRHLVAQGRESDWKRLEAEENCLYDHALTLDLSVLEPQVSLLEDPSAARPAHQWGGTAIAQVVIGPRASYADLALVARVLAGRRIAEGVQLVVVPASRQIEGTAAGEGVLAILIEAGARVVDGNALPAFDGKAAGLAFGARAEQLVGGRGRWYLGSAACAVAAALRGHISDPRELETAFARDLEPVRYAWEPGWILEPSAAAPAPDTPATPPITTVAPKAEHANGRRTLPRSAPPVVGEGVHGLRGVVLLRVADDVGGDQVLPWGARMAPLIGDVAALADHAFGTIDPGFAARARARNGGFVVAGRNFGAGAARLYAALALLELGVRATLARSYAPGFRRQLVEAGVLPLAFANDADLSAANAGDELEIPGLPEILEVGRALTARNLTQGLQLAIRHELGPLECAIARAGGRLAFAARVRGERR